jgi:hypothetical protein
MAASGSEQDAAVDELSDELRASPPVSIDATAMHHFSTISSSDLETTVTTLRAVAGNLAIFGSERFAPLRDAMGPLVQEWLRIGTPRVITPLPK